MKVGYRLYAAVVPSVVGILLVAALSYWGQYARTAPVLVIVLAAVAVVVSLVIAWRNTRYVARRIEALAASADASGATDEIESIDRRIVALGAEASTARASATRAASDAERRVAEYAALIADVAATAHQRAEEARVPVHILLNTGFGELNENQEEMLGSAESALMALDEEVTKLRAIADIDRGALTVTRESVHLGDVLRSLEPMLREQARKEGVGLELEIGPALPRVMAEPQRLRNALRLALTDDIRYAIPGSTVTVQALSSGDAVRVLVEHGSRHPYAGNILLAARLLGAQGGSLEHADGRTVITMPRASGTAQPTLATASGGAP